MASITISVPEALRDWVEARIQTGAYADASDYVRDLIRHDQHETTENEALAMALAVGEASGSSDRQVPEIMASLREELRGDAA
jgi:antitoxin ParD1/3/4